MEYLSRSEANTPQKLPVQTGKKGDYYLEVVSSYADSYRFQKSKVLQKAAESSIKGELTPEINAKLHSELCACAVVGWKLPKEFGEYSQEKARDLLFEYPQLADAVDSFFSKDAIFKKKSTN